MHAKPRSREYAAPRARLPGPSTGLNIGLIGGSFDPAHEGHRHLVDTARRRLGLDWVWVIPAAGNPLKRTQTPFDRRYASAVATLRGPRTRFSTIEPDLGLTYTVDLVRALKHHAPRARFVWIMGADSLRDMHRWKEWRRLASLMPIAVISRPGASPKAGLARFARQYAPYRLPPGAAARLAYSPAPAWVLLTAPFNAASSTAIRAQRAFQPPPPI